MTTKQGKTCFFSYFTFHLTFYIVFRFLCHFLCGNDAGFGPRDEKLNLFDLQNDSFFSIQRVIISAGQRTMSEKKMRICNGAVIMSDKVFIIDMF